MAELTPAEIAKTVTPADFCYRPSWSDRLFERVRQSPHPAWYYYAGLWLATYLLISVTVWVEGSGAFGTLSLAAYDGAAYVVIYLALMQYLDSTAARAFDNFRPFLAELGPTTTDQLRFELTTMPARSTLLAGFMGLLGTALGLLLLVTYEADHLVPARPSQWLIVFLGNFLVTTFFYHTVRQLRMVSRIHSSATQVNLLRREPAYAFSRLTARTGMSWVLAFTMGAVPRISLDLTTLYGPLAWAPMLTAAILAFVLPLLSMQRLLRAEKRRLQADVDHRLETMLNRVKERMEAEQLGKMGDYKTTLDVLMTERELIRRIPTLPWNVGTFAAYLSAVLLPVLIWAVQELLSTLFSGN